LVVAIIAPGRIEVGSLDVTSLYFAMKGSLTYRNDRLDGEARTAVKA
jgi:hypothetical protein